MSYVAINLADSEHKRAHEYFTIAGHPRCWFKNDDVDIDFEYREYLVKKLNLNFDEVAEGANGSTHIVLNNNPIDFKLKIGFFCDNQDHNFGIEVNGKLRYNTDSNECVFFPDDGTIKKIPINGDVDFNSSLEMYYNRGVVNL